MAISVQSKIYNFLCFTSRNTISAKRGYSQGQPWVIKSQVKLVYVGQAYITWLTEVKLPCYRSTPAHLIGR